MCAGAMYVMYSAYRNWRLRRRGTRSESPLLSRAVQFALLSPTPSYLLLSGHTPRFASYDPLTAQEAAS
jgi:hypothetical protein